MRLHDLTKPPRPLPIMLGRRLANTKPGDESLPMLNRLFGALVIADQMRCRWEIMECREAKRNKRVAQVA